MDFLAATDVGKFPRGWALEAGAATLLDYTTLHHFTILFLFLLSPGTEGSRWKLRHPTGSPGGGEDKGLSYSS